MKTRNFLVAVGIAAVCLLLLPVPLQATVVDLTTMGSSGSANGGIFEQMDVQPTGTGVIESFVRIQANVIESGFNTDADNPILDTKKGEWTHSIFLNDIPVVTKDGISYRQFLLDINESVGGDEALISLNELELYIADSGDINIYPISPAILVWDLDSGGDNTIELNYSLNPGSGAGDMYAYIPSNVFGTTNKYVYLYSSFGNPNATSDGFEEWWVLKGPTSVPDASVMLLLGSSFLGLAVFSKKRKTS
jgi:hypothetical protein